MIRRTLVLACAGASLLAASALPSHAGRAASSSLTNCHMASMHHVVIISLEASGMPCETAVLHAKHIISFGRPAHPLGCSHRVSGRDVHWNCSSHDTSRPQHLILVYTHR